MYINHKERKAKIGKINISVSRNNTIKLRFTHPAGKRNDLNIASNTEQGWLNALRIAHIINSDIELNNFDPTLAKYSPNRAKALEIASRKPNLLEIWDRYKELNKARIAQTTQDYLWKDVDRYLHNTDRNLLELF
ncbi:phage integrase family protein [Stanieria sp. NIES-3757]|nr:phage integrase family protein [Stanieria sp. NIES-3757]